MFLFVVSGGVALAALASMIAGLVAHTTVSRSQYEQQDFQSNEAALNRQFQSTEAQTARQFNSLEAAKQRSFEEQMSSTQYQRAIQDMQAAGLNPASIGLGLNGASTPVGSSAASNYVPGGSMPNTGIGNNSYFSSIFSSAVQAAMSKDRNFMNKTIAEMYTSNAKEMNAVTNATKKAIYGSSGKYDKIFNGMDSL